MTYAPKSDAGFTTARHHWLPPPSSSRFLSQSPALTGPCHRSRLTAKPVSDSPLESRWPIPSLNVYTWRYWPTSERECISGGGRGCLLVSRNAVSGSLLWAVQPPTTNHRHITRHGIATWGETTQYQDSFCNACMCV